MEHKSILDRQISPFKQMGAIILLSVILMGISELMPSAPYSSTQDIMPWVVLCGMILFYALVNSVLSFGATDGNIYWMQSIF